MPYSKSNKPPHYIFAISNSFEKEWTEFCSEANKEQKPISEHLRNVIKKHNKADSR